MIGFARAQASYENWVPGDDDCSCDDLFYCENCGEFKLEAGICEECTDEGEATFRFEPFERTDEQDLADPRCPVHGYCTGCTRRSCEDCGGGY